VPGDGPEVSHEVALELPACDAGDREVRFIRGPGDWSDINEERFRVFCVEPGDYRTAGTVAITAGGSEERPRWIRWHDPDAAGDRATHPFHMPASRRAYIDRLQFAGAHHWVIDRVRVHRGVLVERGSSHIVLNRLLIWEQPAGHGVFLTGGSRRNVVQNSVIGRGAPRAGADRNGVMVRNSDWNRIVKNEIVDIAGDAIASGQREDHAGGLIIQDNDLYLTPASYTDGNGNLDPGGDTACAENAIDIKTNWPSTAPPGSADEWYLIEHNRMWGFRPTDTRCGGTGSAGSTIVIHWPRSRGILIRHNVLWDGPIGYTVSKDAPISHHELHDNLFWKLGRPIIPRHIADGRYHRNIIVEARLPVALRAEARRVEVTRNVIIDSGDSPWGQGHESNEVSRNAYYNATAVRGASTADGSLLFPDSAQARHQERCFTARRITAPTEVCIPHGRVTADSPHAGWFDR
jgi:hypothetical protein